MIHGKASTYRNGGCRCVECTDAARADTAAVRLRKRIADGPTEAERFAMEPLPGEEWRAAVGYQGYEVSNLGRVRSFKFHYPRILAQHPNRHGYLRVRLWADNKHRYKFVHGLVMEAFVGPYPPGQEVRHLDDNKSDNRLANLTYGTHHQNMQDRVRNGSHRWSRERAA